MKTRPKQIPAKPGVYFFRGQHGKILYIGKAQNLKNRVGSYFKKNNNDPRIKNMVDVSVGVTWQETGSEIEALILESQLIKKWKPVFNIKLRDDKQYFYVGFTKEEFTKVFITHQPEFVTRGKKQETSRRNKKTWPPIADFIGPFTDGGALKTTLRLLRRIYPYCTCRQKHNNYCLNYHIGKCLGFCCLKRPDLRLAPLLKAREWFANYDVIIYKKNIKAVEEVLTGKKTSLIKKQKKEMADHAKKEKFDKAIELRDKIEKLEKVFENAKIVRDSGAGARTRNNEPRKATEGLKTLLKLARPPQRIEGYDISNIQGGFATGALVVFINGQPDKNQYRKFNIRLNNGPNDVAMLQELLTRRFNHPEWSYPDLIIADGGKTQLNAAIAVLRESGIKNQELSVMALTKDERHRGHKVYLENKKDPILLSKLPTVVRNLILRVDAEAHRFAINYYRKLHRGRFGATVK